METTVGTTRTPLAVCSCTRAAVCDICLDELADEADRLLAAHNVGRYQQAAARVTRAHRAQLTDAR